MLHFGWVSHEFYLVRIIKDNFGKFGALFFGLELARISTTYFHYFGESGGHGRISTV